MKKLIIGFVLVIALLSSFVFAESLSQSVSSAYKGGGGILVQPVCSKKIAQGVTIDVGAIPKEGICRLISKGGAMIFNVNSIDHIFRVTNVTEMTVWFTLDDNPNDTFEATNLIASKDKTDHFALDDTAGLAVTYYKQYPKKGRYADMLIKTEISEMEIVEEPPAGPKQEETKTAPQEIKQSNGPMIVTILVIIAIVVIGWFMVKGKKKSEVVIDEKKTN